MELSRKIILSITEYAQKNSVYKCNLNLCNVHGGYRRWGGGGNIYFEESDTAEIR